jgi:hypothetical protein
MAISPRKSLISPRKSLISPIQSQLPESLDKSLEKSFHATLKHRVSLLNKTLFKANPNEDKIQKLEKGAIRGEGAEVPEHKIPPRPKKKLDFMTSILKSEHKSSVEGTRILKLPKLPFGKHKSYNEEPMFKDRHFLEGNSNLINPERAKDLEEITRKFRLHEKKSYVSNKANRLHSAKPTFCNLASVDVYEMGPGKLICTRDQEAINSYEKDKDRYRSMTKGHYALTYKEIDENEKTNRANMRKTMDFKQQKELIARLLPTKESKRSEISEFYTSKYFSLFNTVEPKKQKIEYRSSSMT